MATIFTYLFLVILRYLVFGFQGEAKPYDHFFHPGCLETPLNPLYDGGIVVNPEFNYGLYGWRSFGYSKIEHRVSSDGNKYIVASERTKPHHSFSQKLHLHKGMHYTFSAWIRASHDKALVAAIFKTKTGYQHIGWGMARGGCWSMMKGGLSVNVSGSAYLYFETENTEVEISADSISLQPFTPQEWVHHQRHNVERVNPLELLLELFKARKSNVQLEVVDRDGWPVPNATVSITQLDRRFNFGCAINHNILQNPAYHNWFISRGFTVTVFENELKWYSTEINQNQVDYTTSDALMQFAQSNGLVVRGHNVFWDNSQCQPNWVFGLSSDALWEATSQRLDSVVSRYKGQLIHWDVMNELLHYNFFENKLQDPSASSTFYKQARLLDGQATMFLNDYNTIECAGDGAASPPMYSEKIRALRAEGNNGPMAIGLEGHFSYGPPNVAYIRASIDQLAAEGLPIWITELDVAGGQATYLHQILHELLTNPSVEGIVLWSAWVPNKGCYQMCLTDDNFNNLDAGNVVDEFLNGLTHANEMPGITDVNGFYQKSLFHGKYEVRINDQDGQQISNVRHIHVLPREEKQYVHRLTVDPLN